MFSRIASTVAVGCLGVAVLAACSPASHPNVSETRTAVPTVESEAVASPSPSQTEQQVKAEASPDGKPDRRAEKGARTSGRVTGYIDVEHRAIAWWNRMDTGSQLKVCRAYGRDIDLVRWAFESELPDWDRDGTMETEWMNMETVIVNECPPGYFP